MQAGVGGFQGVLTRVREGVDCDERAQPHQHCGQLAPEFSNSSTEDIWVNIFFEKYIFGKITITLTLMND